MQGILFKPWKQKAIRESPLDRLWQTRRLDHLKELTEPDKWVWAGTTFEGYAFGNAETQQIITVKPRYRVGETVYIKEALRKDGRLGDCCYDDEYMTPVFRNGVFGKLVEWQWKGYKLSPMFMPAWAARDHIEITDVRPERLGEIENHPEDFKAEGYQPIILDNSAIDGKSFEASMDFAWFENLWDTINPKYPYRTNPWVFRYCFNLIEDKR